MDKIESIPNFKHTIFTVSHFPFEEIYLKIFQFSFRFSLFLQKSMFVHRRSLHAKVPMANASQWVGCVIKTVTVPTVQTKQIAVSSHFVFLNLNLNFPSRKTESFSQIFFAFLIYANQFAFAFAFPFAKFAFKPSLTYKNLSETQLYSMFTIRIRVFVSTDQTCRSDEFTCANGHCIQVFYRRKK